MFGTSQQFDEESRSALPEEKFGIPTLQPPESSLRMASSVTCPSLVLLLDVVMAVFERFLRQATRRIPTQNAPGLP